MAIAKNPKRSTNAVPNVDKEREAEAFISGAGQLGTGQAGNGQPGAEPRGVGPQGVGEPSPATEEQAEQNKKPIMVRVDPDILKRIDRAAKRLGISRSAFIVSSAAERLERME